VFDVLIAGGDVYDGSGAGPVPADVGVCGDRVAAVGRGLPREAGAVVDAAGKAVCPGFINILSHSNLSILHDPRSLGELTQGVTTEVFGEGVSMGPLTPRLKAELEHTSRYLDVEVSWTRLSEYLRHVERRGAAQNIASFIGAGTLRAGAVGYSDRPATPVELDRMRGIAAEEMADGALGIASALVYPPGSYAGTGELASLCEVAAAYDGCYASHVRGEGEQLHASLGEFLRIVREAGLRGEVFHLKAMRRQNWHLMDGAISLIEDARSDGLPVTADVYPYTAGSSGLTRIIPDRYHEGGAAALYDQLSDPGVRAAIRAELSASGRWGDVTEAENVLILRVATEENRNGRAGRSPRSPPPAGPTRSRRRWTSSPPTAPGSRQRSSPCPRRTCGPRSAGHGSASAPTVPRWLPRARSSGRPLIPARTAVSPGSSGTTFGTRRCCRWRTRSAG
jgi:N-acyl-D-amino-acid deacylase